MYGPDYISGAACCEHRPRGDGSRDTRPAATGKAIDAATSEAAPGGEQTPTGGLTTRRDILLMANQNPTGGGAVIALTIPSRDRKFLRGLFSDVTEGVRDDLARFPDQVRNPAALHREEAAYETLSAALDSGSIVVSGDIRCVLCDLAMTIDRENEYERVLAEHAALLGLRNQMMGAQS